VSQWGHWGRSGRLQSAFSDLLASSGYFPFAVGLVVTHLQIALAYTASLAFGIAFSQSHDVVLREYIARLAKR